MGALGLAGQSARLTGSTGKIRDPVSKKVDGIPEENI